MAASIVPVWETVKENAAPLQRGRNVILFEQSAAALLSEKDRVETEQRLAYYEHRIAESRQLRRRRPIDSSGGFDNDDNNDIGDDPLVDWLVYIKFHQEHFPSDTHAQFLLLERCFRAYHRHATYANDARFIRVCCLYAEQTAEPCSTFNELYALHIGHTSAVFWNAWAYVAEKAENFPLAEQVFAKGLRKQAIPIEYLVLRQKRFQRRMTRYWINASSLQHDDDDVDDEPIHTAAPSHHSQRRGILNSISTTSSTTFRPRSHAPPPRATSTEAATRTRSYNTFTDRTAVTRTSTQSSSSQSNRASSSHASATAFPIFVDEEQCNTDTFPNDDGAHTVHRERETEAARWKENRGDAECWNERGGLSTAYQQQPLEAAAGRGRNYHIPPSTTTSVSFAIHMDDDCVAEESRRQLEQSRQTNRHRQARDDRSTSGTSTATAGMASTISTSIVGSLSRNLETAPIVKAGTRPVWKNSLLKDPVTRMEQSFEEARALAGFYTLVTGSSNVNRWSQTNAAPNAVAQLLDSSIMSISLDEVSSTNNTTDTECDAAEDSTVTVNMSRLGLLQQKQQQEDGTPRRSIPITGKPPAITTERRGIFNTSRRDTSFESTAAPIVLNGSMDSSTLDVSSVPKREEQTINTQLALKELSMMFYSPAVIGAGGHTSLDVRTGGLGPILNESGSSDLRTTSMASEVGGSGDLNFNAHGNNTTASPRSTPLQHQRGGQSFVIHCDDVGNDDVENEAAPRNPNARFTHQSGFAEAALRPLTHAPTATTEGPVLQCRRSRNSNLSPPPSPLLQTIGPLSQDSPLQSLTVRDRSSANVGFAIFVDDDNEQTAQSTASLRQPCNATTIDPPEVGETATFSQVEAIFHDLKIMAPTGSSNKSSRVRRGRRDSIGTTEVGAVLNSLLTTDGDKPTSQTASSGAAIGSRPPSMVGGVNGHFHIYADDGDITSLSNIGEHVSRPCLGGSTFRDAVSDFGDWRKRRLSSVSAVREARSPTTFGDISIIASVDDPSFHL